MSTKRFVQTAALIFVFTTRPLLYGQLTGQISGTITDATGAVVAGVDVTVTKRRDRD